jgi:large subunit ribosomal protein L10
MLKSEKPREVENIKNIKKGYSAIGIINMHSLPARQLQKIRDKLRGTAKIRMSRKNIILRALKASSLDALAEKVSGETALIFTNENPFRLFKILKESRAPAAAKTGQTATKDIVIPKGPTPLAPGPAISTLQKVGLKTTVQQGKIAVTADKVVAKKGDTITPDMVEVFSLLKIEPMEVGLDLMAIWENGTIYESDVLDIDEKGYMENIMKAVQHSVSLSLEIGWITPDTAQLAITKAFMEAKSIAIEANVITKDFIDEMLMKAVREEKALEDVLDIKEPEDEKEENTSGDKQSDNDKS